MLHRYLSVLEMHCCCGLPDIRLSSLSLAKSMISSRSNNWYNCRNGVHPSSEYASYDPRPPWRIMFFGTDSFAVNCLRALCSKYRAGTIIESLDITTTFSEDSLIKNPVYELAKSENITLYKWPPRDNDLRGKYDLGVVVSFGHLIPSEIIKSFPLGILNVHASLLPRWRGAAPVIRAILNGDTETGVSIMKIEPKKFDVGDVVRQYSVTIGPEESAEELTNRLSEIGARLLMECIRDLPRSVQFATPQSTENISYAKKVFKEDAKVDWSEKTAEEVFRLYRAINHLYPLTTSWFDHPVKLLNIKLDDVTDFNPANRAVIDKLGLTNPIFPGLVEFSPTRLVIRVQCKDGHWINASTILMPRKRSGKTCLSAIEFYNGYISKVEYTLDRKFRCR